MAGVLAQCGADFGETYAGTPENPKGFFENKELRENVVKQVLRRYGFDPLGQKNLPPVGTKFDIDPEWLRSSVEAVIGNKEESAYKCCKAAFWWRNWEEAFPDIKWIIVRRGKRAIAESCARTHFMRACSDVDSWIEWVEMYEYYLDDLFRHAKRAIQVWPSHVLHGNASFQFPVRWCGLHYDRERVSDFIDRDLYRE